MAAFLGQVPLLGRGAGGGGGGGGFRGGPGGFHGGAGRVWHGRPGPRRRWAPDESGFCGPEAAMGTDGWCYPNVPQMNGYAHGGPLAVHPQPGSEPWCAPDEIVGDDGGCHPRPKGMKTNPLFQGHF